MTLMEYGRYADSLSVCFSKGLGAPVGSAVVGSKSFIEDALRYRKIFGGGMRQAGILAAAALYALENNLNRIQEDHANAKVLAAELNKCKAVKMPSGSIETNMVIFDPRGTGLSQEDFLRAAASAGVLMTPERDTQARAVTHLNVTREDVLEAARRIISLLTR